MAESDKNLVVQFKAQLTQLWYVSQTPVKELFQNTFFLCNNKKRNPLLLNVCHADLEYLHLYFKPSQLTLGWNQSGWMWKSTEYGAAAWLERRSGPRLSFPAVHLQYIQCSESWSWKQISCFLHLSLICNTSTLLLREWRPPPGFVQSTYSTDFLLSSQTWSKYQSS